MNKSLLVLVCIIWDMKVRKKAKIRNQYNQVPNLTQAAELKVPKKLKHNNQQSLDVIPYPIGGHKAASIQHRRKAKTR